MLTRLKFAETMREAVTLVEQGHIRVGPETITDPAYLVSACERKLQHSRSAHRRCATTEMQVAIERPPRLALR